MINVISGTATVGNKVERTSMTTHEITLKTTLANLTNEQLDKVFRWKAGESLNIIIAPEQLDLIDYIECLEHDDKAAAEISRLKMENMQLKNQLAQNDNGNKGDKAPNDVVVTKEISLFSKLKKGMKLLFTASDNTTGTIVVVDDPIVDIVSVRGEHSKEVYTLDRDAINNNCRLPDDKEEAA
ncbi:MAG: hypothetical protein ABFD54_04370 [Armatimonadota bacterium]